MERRLDEFLADIKSNPGRLEELRAPPKKGAPSKEKEKEEGEAVADVTAEDVEGTAKEEGGGGGQEEEGDEGDDDPQAIRDTSRPFTCAVGCRYGQKCRGFHL